MTAGEPDYWKIKTRIADTIMAESKLYETKARDKTRFRNVSPGAPMLKMGKITGPIPSVYVTTDDIIEDQYVTAGVRDNSRISTSKEIHLLVIFIIDGRDGPQTERSMDKFTKLLKECLKANQQLRIPGETAVEKSDPLISELETTQVAVFNRDLTGEMQQGRVIRVKCITEK